MSVKALFDRAKREPTTEGENGDGDSAVRVDGDSHHDSNHFHQADPKRELIERLRSTYADEIATLPFFGDMMRELERDADRLTLGQMRRKVKRVNKLAAQAKGNRGSDVRCWYCGQVHSGYTCPVDFLFADPPKATGKVRRKNLSQSEKEPAHDAKQASGTQPANTCERCGRPIGPAASICAGCKYGLTHDE